MVCGGSGGVVVGGGEWLRINSGELQAADKPLHNRKAAGSQYFQPVRNVKASYRIDPHAALLTP